MAIPKIIIVEDNDADLTTFHSTLSRYSEEKKRSFETVDVKNLEEANDKIDNTFDGAIIDLKLNGNSDAGNQIINRIIETYRIPIVVFTATPDNVDKRDFVRIYKKGEDQYDVVLDLLFDFYQSGLTKILGGRGQLEVTMNYVFWHHILPIIKTWTDYVAQGKETEKALLRFTISHIFEALDNETEYYFPEEMYIAPPISETIKSGSIVKRNGAEDYCIVLSPSCDLVIHKGNIKTDRIMVCSIEKADMSLVVNAKRDLAIVISEKEEEKSRKEKQDNIDNAKALLGKLQRNGYSSYFHFLPRTCLFSGGFINFRKIETYTPSNFKKMFEKPIAQVTSAFIKDIVSRLSTYYARQGQPDFDFDNLVL